MSGMQDVATLADRYSTLSATAQKLNRNIERLKKEVGIFFPNLDVTFCNLCVAFSRQWSRMVW